MNDRELFLIGPENREKDWSQSAANRPNLACGFRDRSPTTGAHPAMSLSTRLKGTTHADTPVRESPFHTKVAESVAKR